MSDAAAVVVIETDREHLFEIAQAVRMNLPVDIITRVHIAIEDPAERVLAVFTKEMP